MTPDELIAERRPVWDELDELVRRAQRRGPRSLSGEQAHRLIHLYRDVSADLARLQALGAEPDQLRGVNRVVSRAHGQLYGRRPRSRLSLWRFFASDYPRLVRRRWPFLAASLAIFLAFSGMGYLSVQTNPSVVADLLGGAEDEFRGDKTGEDFRARFENTSSPLLSSWVTTNNIRVAFMAYALGITAGVGTVYALMINGTMLGGFAGAYAQDGAQWEFWQTVLVHGALELTAIVIAAGAGLLMGFALWCPGRRTRMRALREDARDAALIVLGLIPAFIVAGFLEGFVTPAQNIPAGVKLALGVAIMGIYWLYLAVGGLRRSSVGPDTPLRRTVLR
ncbi:MAG: stage II sporulation protein M [Phycisphaerae bacterium]